jgi:hypothetical protein
LKEEDDKSQSALKEEDDKSQSIRILQPQLIEKDDVLLWSPPPIPDISYSISSSSSSAAESGPDLKRRKIIVKGRY